MDLFEFPLTYLYFWGSFIALITTFLVYILKPNLRKEILRAGLYVAFWGVIFEYFFFKDYWTPELILTFGEFGGLEDLMFGFAAGGIGAVVFSIFSEHKYERVGKRHYELPILMALVQLSAFLLLNVKLGVNSILASTVALILSSLYIVLQRPDLLTNALITGISFGFLLAFAEWFLLTLTDSNYLSEYYLLHNSVPVLFEGFVLTEFLWGFSFGATLGPSYEFVWGIKEKK
jgi:hypothetical protein